MGTVTNLISEVALHFHGALFNSAFEKYVSFNLAQKTPTLSSFFTPKITYPLLLPNMSNISSDDCTEGSATDRLKITRPL